MVNKPIIGVAALIFVLAAGGFYYLKHRNASSTAVPVLPPSGSPSLSEAGVAHPLPEASTNTTSAGPLPDLAGSDVPLRDALAQLTGADAVKNYLAPEDLIRRMVVTIDNLPRQKVAVAKRPTTGIGGTFEANGDELHATLDKQNFDRYKPMVAVIRRLDMQQLAAIYIRFYHCFSSRTRTSDIRPGISMIGWCKSSMTCWQVRNRKAPLNWYGLMSCTLLRILRWRRAPPVKSC